MNDAQFVELWLCIIGAGIVASLVNLLQLVNP
jgi:hypothetical protein